MRYFRLWFSFLKMSAMADFEYRVNIILRIIGEMSWYAAQLSVFEVLYLHTSTISGWDVHAMRVFMGTLFTVDVLYMILFMENMDNFSSVIKQGDLDMYLAKPINAQFMVSFRKIAVAYMLNFCGIVFYLVWGIRQLPGPVTFAQVASFVFLIPVGLTILYSLRFMFATLSILLHDAGNIQFVWHQLWRLGTRPDPIYPFTLRLLVFTIFPVAFFASVPARVFVEGVEYRFLIAAPIFAFVLVKLSQAWWNFALKRYASASS